MNIDDFQHVSTPEPRDGGEVAGPAPSSSLVRGWRRLAVFNARINDCLAGDALGVLGLAALIVSAFFLSAGWSQ
jgi:hypothetical protein